MLATFSNNMRHGVPTRTNPDDSLLKICAGRATSVLEPTVASIAPSLWVT
jgi:hypothetical protein